MTQILDKDAFRRLTPKEMHPHMVAFDQFLSALVKSDPAVKKYIENPFALFSVEKAFPILHVVALCRAGHWRFFSPKADFYHRREGHRFVNQEGGDSIKGMQPVLRLEVVSDPSLTVAFDVAVAKKMIINEGDEHSLESSRLTELAKATERPAVLFSAPLGMMKKGEASRFSSQRYTLYQHILGEGHEYPEDGSFYIGITSREWKRRWAEHRAAMMRGSRLKFHREYASRVLEHRLTYVHHKVMGLSASLDQIQDLEEALVAGHWEDGRLLNMIPGGKAGIKYIHEHAMVSGNTKVEHEDIEKVLETWLRENPRKGLPAPWVARRWEDDDYALKIICGPEGRLSVEQVLQIRLLASGGLSAEFISAQVGAKNALQVQRVLDGKTYGRVKNNSSG